MSAVPGAPSGRLGMLVTSPRVAPGLLSHGAWQVVQGYAVRLARSFDEPVAQAVEEAGFTVEEVGEVSLAELARRLVDLAGAVSVVWLGSADGDPGLADAVAAEVSRLATPPEVELVVGSWDVQGGRLLDVVATMDRLRSPGGCPWDAEQTHLSLATFLVEETGEVLDAIESGDDADLVEELGDLLLQVYFHAEIARGQGRFDLDDVASGIADKLIRRHPYVFGDAAVPDDLNVTWEARKRAEKGRTSSLGGIAENLSSLARAVKIVTRARHHGVEVELASASITADEVGRAIIDLVARAQASGVDADQATRVAVRALEERVRIAEQGPGEPA